MTENLGNLGDFFDAIGQEKKKKEEEFRSVVGDIDLGEIFSGLKEEKKKIEKKKKKEEKQIEALEQFLFSEEEEKKEESPVENIEEVINEKIEEVEKLEEIEEVLDEVIEKEDEETIDHAIKVLDKITEKTEVNEESENLSELEKIKRELGYLRNIVNTQGGGGEVNLKYLDDIVGIATNASAYDGKFLKYNDSIGKFEFTTTAGGGYTLPTASGSTLGGVKIGDGLTINGSGVLSTSGGGSTGVGGTWEVDSVGINTTKNVGIGATAKEGYALYVDGNANYSGIITATTFSGSGASLNSIPYTSLTGITTDIVGDTTPQLGGSLDGNSKNIFGVGIITATKLVGDGSGLTGIVASGSGVVIKDDDSAIGTAGTINFGTNLSVSALSAGIVTVTASAGTIAGISTTGTSFFNQINSTGVITATSFDGSLATTDLTGTITNAQLAGSIANAKLSNSTVSYGGISLSLGGSDATPAFDLSDATNYPTTSLSGTITNAQLAGSIANAKLSNSSVSYGGISLSLGGSDATPAFDLSDATNYPTSSLSGTITNAQLAGSIAASKLAGSIGNAKLSNSSVSYGGISLSLGGSDATPAFDLSDATNYPTSSLSGTITNAQLAGSIANSKLANDSVSFGGIEVDLGASDATPAFDLSDATNYPTTSLSGTITNAQLAGSIAAGKLAGSIGNDKLSNSSVSYGGVSLSLGGSDATPAFNLSDATAYPYTSLTGISTEIVGDTTPQLGGDLDFNSKTITGTGGVNLTGVVTATSLDTATINSVANLNVASNALTIGDANDTITIAGNLTVNGTEIIINTDSLEVEDRNIGIASTASGSKLDNAGLDGAGITIYGSQGDKTLTWNNSNSRMQFNTALSATSFSGSGSGLTNIPNSALTNSSVSYGGVSLSLGGSDATPAFDLSDATNYPTSSLSGTITNAQLAGSIANAKLANSSVSYGGISLSLGGSDATPAFDLSDATNYPTSSLSGTITNAQLAGSIANSKLANDSVSFGGIEVDLGASDATPAFDLSDATNYPTSSLSGTITNAQLAGSIANAKLSNSSVSYGGVSLSLGGSDATPAFDLSDATNYPTSSLSGTITNAQLAGSIANAKLSNSSVSYGGVELALGASDATPAFDLSDATNYPTSSLSGTITNAQLAGSIADSKLSTISTAGKVDLAALEIDGGTDIGAALADADLFIVDDAGGGTNRKTAASRIKTYVADITLTTAAQTNITSVGTLSALTVSGNVSMGSSLMMGDDDTIWFGDGADGYIKSDGTNFSIRGSGTTYLRGSEVKISANGGSGGFWERVRVREDDVWLYYGSDQVRLKTTSDGLQLNGDISIADKIVHTGDTNTAIRFPEDDTITAETGGTERLRIDSSGDVVIGANASTTISGAGTPFQVHGSDGYTGMSIIRSASAGAQFQFAAGSSGDNVSDNDTLGHFKFFGYHTDGYDEYARITGEVDGTNGNGDAPGALVFSTTADGASSVSERLRITSAGLVGIGEDSPLGNLHVKTADSGASVGASADELVLENSSNTGMTILSGTTGEGTINFGDSGDVNPGRVVYMHNGDYMYFNTNDAERLRITSSGELLVNHTAAVGSGKIQSYTSNSDAIDIAAYSTTAGNGGRLTFYRSKNATIGSNTEVADNDSLGRIDWRGYNDDGTAFNIGATIEAEVDGTINSTTDMPSAILFKTSADGSATPTERLRIDSSGKVLINCTTPVSTANSINAQLQIQGTSAGSSSASLIRNTDDAASPYIIFGKTRGTSVGSNTVVQDGDCLGAIRFAGADGTDVESYGGMIKLDVDGTPDSNDMPGRLEFHTTPAGAATPTERLRIDSTGHVMINTQTSSSNAILHINGQNNYDFTGNANQTHYPIFNDIHFTGSDTITANRTKAAIRNDIEYSITSGTSSSSGDRISLYGIHNSVNTTKAAYTSVGGYLYVSNAADNAAASQTVQGVYGYARGYGTNAGVTYNIYGGYFLGYRGGNVNTGHCYGVYARSHQSTNGSNKGGDMTGIYSEVEIDEDNVTNVYAFRAYLDRDAGTITNSYILYGSHGGDSSFTNRWGIYLSDSAKSYVAGNFEIGGTLTKGGGSFRINHPLPALKDEKDLVHSFIEGPQMDLIYRGKVDLVNGTASVNIDTKAGMTEGTFVLLNRDIQCFTSNETGWTAVKGSVTGNIITIVAQDNTCTDTISWMVVGERQDDTVKSLTMTDDNGDLIVEPDRSTHYTDNAKYQAECEKNEYNEDPNVNPNDGL